jgi:hypothetical protein
MNDDIQIKLGSHYTVFDYGNDIFGEDVLFIEYDVYSGNIVYKRDNGEYIHFSGQGFFNK